MINVREVKGEYIEITPVDIDELKEINNDTFVLYEAIEMSRYSDDFVVINASEIPGNLSEAPMILSEHGSYYFDSYMTICIGEELKNGQGVRLGYNNQYSKEDYYDDLDKGD